MTPARKDPHPSLLQGMKMKGLGFSPMIVRPEGKESSYGSAKIDLKGACLPVYLNSEFACKSTADFSVNSMYSVQTNSREVTLLSLLQAI